ncbi:MAG: hypothetical protein KDE27_26550 [Planctomycetes bacterium]|nr:hypothetical protein [Planctomycetota bacterium]
MRRAFLVLGAAASFVSTVAAQDFLGFSYHACISATSRGTVGSSAGEILTRIDGDEYAGWGLGAPGMRTISSVFLIVQDQDAVATPEVFDVYLYAEDGANPGFPDLATRTTFATAVAGPPAPAAGVISAVAKVVTPALPVAVPIQGGGDVFVAFAFPAAAWPLDGLSAQLVLGSGVAAADVPGRAQQPPAPTGPNNSHGLSRVAGGLSYDSTRNWVIDIEHDTAAGCVLGITNQPSCPASHNPPPAGSGPAPGTADFMSGVAPDVSGFHPGRVDDVTMDYYRTGSGAPLVFFLADVGTFGPEVPVASFTAGSGVFCVNAASFLTLGVRIGMADEAFLTTTFPAAIRPSLAGFPLVQQAVEFDVGTGLAHASPCGRQRF